MFWIRNTPFFESILRLDVLFLNAFFMTKTAMKLPDSNFFPSILFRSPPNYTLYEQAHVENTFLSITNATVSHELRNPL